MEVLGSIQVAASFTFPVAHGTTGTSRPNSCHL